MEERRKEIRMMIGGDFNTRTGKLGGRWEVRGEKEERKEERKSKDKKINKEGRYLIDRLAEAGCFIYNGCEKRDEEGM